MSEPSIDELWPEFARAATDASTDGPAPAGVLTLPLAAAAAGHQAWLRELGPVLRALLERQVQWIELASIGPTHRALAKVVAALVANGVDIGPTLTTAAAAWAKAT
ncbi:MAG: hypothetical protein IPL61_37950 [Myxococcales bacterium]|nr:hypothetical protein [Myxococcales bacterium]